MPDIDLNSQVGGWVAFIGLIVTLVIMFARGDLSSGRITEMWKSAYENERDARRADNDAREKELGATMATLIHMLKSFQTPGSGGENE